MFPLNAPERDHLTGGGRGGSGNLAAESRSGHGRARHAGSAHESRHSRLWAWTADVPFETKDAHRVSAVVCIYPPWKRNHRLRHRSTTTKLFPTTILALARLVLVLAPSTQLLRHLTTSRQPFRSSARDSVHFDLHVPNQIIGDTQLNQSECVNFSISESPTGKQSGEGSRSFPLRSLGRQREGSRVSFLQWANSRGGSQEITREATWFCSRHRHLWL